MRRIATVVVVLALTAAACDGDGGGGTAVGADVVTTTPVLADLVEAIVGDQLTVRSLIPVGADPHEFRLSEFDFEAVEAARLVVMTGAGFEPDASAVRNHAVEAERPVVLAANHLAQPVQTPEGDVDPHFWHDPEQMAAVARAVGDRLAEVDPERARSHRAAARSLAREYQDLAEEMEEVLAVVSEQRRVLITQHDFFRYFARRFGFDVLGTIAPGLSSLGQPTAESRLALIETIDDRSLCALFTPASTPGTLSEGIADEAETEVEVVRVFGDTLPDAETGYADAMAENARRVSAALTGCG